MSRMRFARTAAAATGLILAIALCGCEQPASEGRSQVVDGLRLEYGVVRSETVLVHPLEHLERIMHHGVPTAPFTYHIVLAIFDATNGARIQDAGVSLEVFGPGYRPGRKVMPLESMAAVGDLTYGGYISLPESARYRLTFDIAHAAGRPDTVKALFLFDRPS